ncbi:hypothetical protein [Hymenobacter sp. DG01]|uniref:hypothetical protein n=1 Tax=Hymenobacter sp. DG01 TaxID=2584940 RepID=UPI001120CCB9|nr:hypothetical protein [Hymenobacter sp. DG01]
MKKFLYALLLAASALSVSACRDEDNLPFPKTEEFPLVFTNLTTQNTFKLADVQGTGNPTTTFNIEVKGGDASKIEAIEVYRSFRGYNKPAAGVTRAIGTGPRVLLRTVAPSSGSIEVSINDLITGLTRASGATQTGARVALTRASLEANEGFLFTYELVLKDGRRIVYTPLSGGIVSGIQASAPYAGIVTIVQ